MYFYLFYKKHLFKRMNLVNKQKNNSYFQYILFQKLYFIFRPIVISFNVLFSHSLFILFEGYDLS